MSTKMTLAEATKHMRFLTAELSQARAERDAAVAERNLAAAARDDAFAERDDAFAERDAVLSAVGGCVSLREGDTLLVMPAEDSQAAESLKRAATFLRDDLGIAVMVVEDAWVDRKGQDEAAVLYVRDVDQETREAIEAYLRSNAGHNALVKCDVRTGAPPLETEAQKA